MIICRLFNFIKTVTNLVSLIKSEYVNNKIYVTSIICKHKPHFYQISNF